MTILFFIGCSHTSSILTPFENKPDETKQSKPQPKSSLSKTDKKIKKKTHKAASSIALEKTSQETYSLSTVEAMTVCWRNENNYLICDGPLPKSTDLFAVSIDSYFKGTYKGGKHCTPRKGPVRIGDKQVYYCDFPLNPDNRLGYPVIEDTIKKYGLRLTVARKKYRCKDEPEFVGNCVESGTAY